MGGEESALPYGCVKAGNAHAVPCQITIALHGKRRMGKTLLLSRMRNSEAPQKYEPTPTMQSMEFLWKPMGTPDETIKVTVWEVVEKALRGEEVAPDVVLPDASTVDTLRRCDGVIVMYDPDDDESAEYAAGIVRDAPDEVPILVIANFIDVRKYEPKEHEVMDALRERIVHVQASVLATRGLSSVAKWLDEPLMYHRKLTAQTMAEQMMREMATLKDDLRNMSATLDADLYDARPGDDADVIDDAIPLEFRVDASPSEFLEVKSVDKGFSVQLNFDGL